MAPFIPGSPGAPLMPGRPIREEALLFQIPLNLSILPGRPTIPGCPRAPEAPGRPG